MDKFVYPVQLRWSDFDPNFHLRHSVYYDWGAMCRVAFLEQGGLTMQRFRELQTGPILFREECIFRREILYGDPVTVDLVLVKARRDFSRFTIRHRVMKNPETLSAILTVDIAWLDAVKRKLTKLPESSWKVLSGGPFAEDFQWEG